MKILQFGTGRFLRGFFDPIVAQPHSIIVVQSHEASRGAALINSAADGYHVWTRGTNQGRVVDEFEKVSSLGRAVIAHDGWGDMLSVSADPQLQLVVSNTTEHGLQLDPRDREWVNDQCCPHSYPAKLLTILWTRFRAGASGLTVLPLELVESNGQVLKQLVLRQAGIWPQTNRAEFLRWLADDNRWLSNLVDRIVVSVTDSPPWGAPDPLAVVAEPFQMLAIQDDGRPRAVIPHHPMVEWVEDLAPVFLRKVRILNGLHTAMVARGLGQGFTTVREVVRDPQQRAWIESLLEDEILPTLASRGFNAKRFAQQTLERFENPFIEHKLADIANHHDAKLKTRIAPTAREFREAFAREPSKLMQVLAAEPVMH